MILATFVKILKQTSIERKIEGYFIFAHLGTLTLDTVRFLKKRIMFVILLN